MVHREAQSRRPPAGGQEKSPRALSCELGVDRHHEAHDAAREEPDTSTARSHPDRRPREGLDERPLPWARQCERAGADRLARFERPAAAPQRPDLAVNNSVAMLRCIAAAEIYRLSGELPEWARDGS